MHGHVCAVCSGRCVCLSLGQCKEVCEREREGEGQSKVKGVKERWRSAGGSGMSAKMERA